MGNRSDAPRRHPGSHERTPANPKRRVGGGPGAPKAVAAVAGVVVLANIAAAAGLYSIGAWPSQFTAGSSGPDDALPASVAGSDSAASATVAATIATSVPGYTGPADAAVGAGQMTAYPCIITLPTQPVVGRHRTFNSAGRSVEVTVSAFPAGTGLWTLAETNAQSERCAQEFPAVSTSNTEDGPGVAATRVNVPAGTALTFRRGDVLVRVQGQASDVDTIGGALDETLATQLSACADQVGAPGDERRNPWLDGVPYQGLFVDTRVTTPEKGLPAPPAGVRPVPVNAVPIVFGEVPLPSRPADPVWPAELPAAMAEPIAPVPVGPEPTTATVKVPREDRIGPGCGWAFTSAAAPAVDEAALAARAAALQNETLSNLRAKQDSWAPAVITFYRRWQNYRIAAAKYVQYSRSVAAVAAAWQQIQTERDVYFELLAAYEQAVTARTDFLSAQRDALTAYTAAIAECSLPLPSSTPAPLPSVSGSPAPSTSPIPDPIESRVGCPPTKPEILSQLPPVLPPEPTPPPDPRPVDQRN